MIKIGEINSFIVMRKSDIGYMLKNKEDEVLLHFKQALGEELEEGSVIECFVQPDSKGRISATLEKPTATISKPGWGVVVDSNPKMGVFVNIGTFKDVLVSKDVLPFNVSLWPELNDKLFVQLGSHKGRLIAYLLTKTELNLYNPELKEYPLGSKVIAHVCRSTNQAVNAVTDDLNYVYISSKQFRGTYRVGEEVEVMIIGSHEDELVGSLNKVKEELVLDDEAVILNYLNSHDGKMPFTAKSSAEAIEEAFHMSRKAFKRAIGDLYKNRKVYFDENSTYLTKE